MQQEIQEKILQVLGAFPAIKIAYVFGSAARDRLTSRSDVDVAVAADTRLSMQTRIELITQLSQALHREVDVVDLQAVNGEIVQQSLCHGVPILRQDTALHAQILSRMWFHEADMMPYIRRILAERRQRFFYGQ